MDEKELIKIISEEIIKFLKEHKNENNKLSKSSSVNIIGENLGFKEELEKICEINNNSGNIVITDISIEDFVFLSNGSCINENGRKLLEYILLGKKIIILTDGIEWMNYPNIPKKLQKQYLEYQKKIENFGIKIMNKSDIIEYFQKNNPIFPGRVLDLRKVKELYEHGNDYIEISNNTIVTELAKEFCLSHKIKIIVRCKKC